MNQTKTLKTACRCAQFCMLRISMCVASFLFTSSTMVSMIVLKVYLSLYTLLRSHLFVNCCIRRYSLYRMTTTIGRHDIFQLRNDASHLSFVVEISYKRIVPSTGFWECSNRLSIDPNVRKSSVFLPVAANNAPFAW